MPQVHRHKRFKKSYQKLSVKVQKVVKRRLQLFASDQFNEVLNNHALRGKYEGCRSINVTGDYRIIYSEVSDFEVLLIDIGTHSQLYG